MKITIFGATGRTGSEVLRLALEDGHEVKVLVRSPEKLEAHERLTIVKGDVRDTVAVKNCIKGADIVFSALGTDKTTTLTEAVPAIIEGMETEGVNRVVTIGTAGILQSRLDPAKLRYQAGDSNRKLTFAAEEHHKVFTMLQRTSLEWTIVCPTYLPDGKAEGGYRVERDRLPLDGKQITTGDTADFAYRELISPEYAGHRVGIAY